MIQIVQITIALFAIANLANAGLTPCSDPGKGTLNAVIIEGCDMTNPCIVKRGQSVNLEIDFTPQTNSDSLEVDVYGILPFIPVPIPFPGFDTNGCQTKYNIECPLVGNTQYQYKNQLNVPTLAPTGTLGAEIKLKDASGSTIVCFDYQLTIQ